MEASHLSQDSFRPISNVCLGMFFLLFFCSTFPFGLEALDGKGATTSKYNSVRNLVFVDKINDS